VCVYTSERGIEKKLEASKRMCVIEREREREEREKRRKEREREREKRARACERERGHAKKREGVERDRCVDRHTDRPTATQPHR